MTLLEAIEVRTSVLAGWYAAGPAHEGARVLVYGPCETEGEARSFCQQYGTGGNVPPRVVVPAVMLSVGPYSGPR